MATARAMPCYALSRSAFSQPFAQAIVLPVMAERSLSSSLPIVNRRSRYRWRSAFGRAGFGRRSIERFHGGDLLGSCGRRRFSCFLGFILRDGCRTQRRRRHRPSLIRLMQHNRSGRVSSARISSSQPQRFPKLCEIALRSRIPAEKRPERDAHIG